MEARVTRATAVVAVATWTALALRVLASPPTLPPSTSASTVATVAHSTASTVTTQWLRDGLDHVQQQHKQYPVEASGETEAPKVRDETVDLNGYDGDAPVGMTTWETDAEGDSLELAAIRSMAEDVANTAIQSVVSQLRRIEQRNESGLDRTREATTPMAPATGSDASDATTCAPSSGDDDGGSVAMAPVAVEETQEQSSPPPTNTVDNGLHERVACEFVSSLFGVALHQHQPDAALTQSLPETPPPRRRKSTPRNAADSKAKAPEAVPQAPVPPTSSGDKPPIVLGAVMPPKHGAHRPPQRKPMAGSMSATTSSPRLAPVDRPPKTADHHLAPTQLRPIGGRTPRTSPRPTSHDHESQSPPRLRKLEEYLEMHPVDRAKKIYRPRRPPPVRAPHHEPASRHANGYEAEHDDSGDELDGGVGSLPPPRVKLVPLRGAVNPAHPALPATSHSASSPSPPVVDRPDRLGLLNKPKKRSGFCQQCGFEGRSCKVSDCLKHQPLR